MSNARERGFTLIEILIAMTVFAIAILGVAAMQTSSVRGNTQARVIGEEVLEACSRIEELRMLSYDDLDTDTSDDGKATWTVTPVPDEPDDEYKMVNFTYTWQLRGATKTYTINFIRSPE